MARGTYPDSAPATDVSFLDWKAAAAKALAAIYERAALTNRDGLWTKLYARGLRPEEAAKATASEDQAHRSIGA